MRPAPPNHQQPGEARETASDSEGTLSNGTLFLLVSALGVLIVTSLGYRLLEAANFIMLGGLVVGCLIGVAVLAWGMLKHGWLMGKGQKYYDPGQVAMRVSGAAFSMEINLIVILRSKSQVSRANKLLTPRGCRLPEF